MMGRVSDEDKEGFINLNVRVHRDDIYDACVGEDEDLEVKHKKYPISRALFKRIAQQMRDHTLGLGGDLWSDACREAYELEIGGN